ncbi:Poly-beta-1,6-N-acetyl-D-glucosamine N-deacetylase precursor [Chromobacterium violaceum]|uniref:Poly-beta-1,6-N-acetyl-D-glucosamine N-deacetylase n=1 Tax=Chromobacterium violaceum TaxID=536 RepID=A0A447TLA9_CHRVL|nr:Poly-beta-1,6-N-acetyl-D-glucosamine N-deacetylase precursor [Chromobacterium violaceum]
MEVASHSYAMHHGVVANPQGNALPAYTSPAYAAAGGYESRERYLRRAADDLARNSALLRDKLGRAPRVMIWPYGSHSGELDRLAASAGMPLTLSLEDGLNPPGQPLYSLRRVLVTAGMGVDGFAAAIRRREAWPDGRQPGRSASCTSISTMCTIPIRRRRRPIWASCWSGWRRWGRTRSICRLSPIPAATARSARCIFPTAACRCAPTCSIGPPGS